MAKLNQDAIQGEIKSAYVIALFDKGKELLESNGYKIISLEENARLRMQEGGDSFISKSGNWVKEDFIYTKDKGVYLTKNSPICENAKKATTCNDKCREFYLTDEQIEKSLANSLLLLRTAEKSQIPTNDFKNNEITNFIFGSSAEDYGNFLKENGIKDMPIWFVDLENMPSWSGDLKNKSFARKVFFRGFDCWSGLYSPNWGLGYNYESRGVKK